MFSISTSTAVTFGTTLALIGDTASITTTATQTLTGSIDFTFDTSTINQSIQVGYALCYSAGTLEGFDQSAGVPIVNFVQFTTSATSTAPSSANASGSVVPGIGTWNVGLCAEATGGALKLTEETGWIMQTNN
jgi:hypothetical protein